MSRKAAERRCEFDPDVPPADLTKNRSLFFDDLLDAKVREFNPRYAEAEGALFGKFRHLHTNIYGNREFVEHLRSRASRLPHRGRVCDKKPCYATPKAGSRQLECFICRI